MNCCSKFILLLSATLCCCMAAFAQREQDTLQRTHSIDDVVVTGQYQSGTTEQAVQKIKVIGRAQIDAMGAQNLRDVLTNESSLRLTQDNILGSSASIQGVSGNNIKYLIDGVPVIGRQDGNIDLSEINLNNIERIEIVKGPMSVSYGNNALGGTINLITKKTQKKTLEAALNAYYESIGTYNLTGRLGYKKGRSTIMVSGGRNFFDGWNSGDKINLDFSAHLADSSRFQTWKPREQYFGDAQYSYRLRSTSFTYRSSLFKEDITNFSYPSTAFAEKASDDHYHTNRFDNAFFINSTAMANHVINFQVACNQYERIKNTFTRDLTTLSSTLSQNPGDQDTSKFTLLQSRATISSVKDGSRLHYEIGYDINLESATGARIEGNKKQIGDYALFASAEYSPAENLTIRPGLRAAYNTDYPAPLTPSVNVLYRIGSSLKLRGSYARGFRSPDLKELYFYFVDVNHNIKGNPDLKAESSNNFTASADYKTTTGIVTYRLEADGFYNNIHNQITLAISNPATTEYTYINVGKFMSQGAGFTGTLWVKQLALTAGVTEIGYYNQLSETEAVPVYSYSPELRGNMLYGFGKGLWTTGLFYKYTGRLPGYAIDASNNILRTYTAAYQTADVSLARFLFKKQLHITIGAKNLFDVKNISAFSQGSAHSSGGASIPMSTGRSYFLKLDLNFHSQS